MKGGVGCVGAVFAWLPSIGSWMALIVSMVSEERDFKFCRDRVDCAGPCSVEESLVPNVCGELYAIHDAAGE